MLWILSNDPRLILGGIVRSVVQGHRRDVAVWRWLMDEPLDDGGNAPQRRKRQNDRPLRDVSSSQRLAEEQKANDEGYKATIKRTPSSNKKVDPWGSLRTAPGK
jgi:hypothetical protein